MRRWLFSAGYVLTIGIVIALTAAAESTEAQVSGTEYTDHADAVELQRKAESALDRIQQNDVGQGIVDATSYIEWAAHAEPRRVVPVLEAYFGRSHESDLRAELASVLVSLGDEDPRYWNLILNQAQAALREDPPDPFEMGKDGESSALCSSEAFQLWAKQRSFSADEACKKALLEIPGQIRPLADCGDRRVIPVLQPALDSHHRLIQALAVRGLILTRDHDAITLVIETIEHAPQDKARALADSLIESDDPRAQSVVHQYLPDVNFVEAHQFRAQNAQWRRPILISK
jgi:HEAT repeat protein